ncbi:MAG: hypothetical protein AAGE94_24085, partial [Acidobacteriota bacterium]
MANIITIDPNVWLQGRDGQLASPGAPGEDFPVTYDVALRSPVIGRAVNTYGAVYTQFVYEAGLIDFINLPSGIYWLMYSGLSGAYISAFLTPDTASNLPVSVVVAPNMIGPPPQPNSEILIPA